MKYSVIQIDGGYAVGTGRKYFADTLKTNHDAALVQAIQMSAGWHQQQMDKLHARLEKLGAVDSDDPKGYLA